MKSLKNPMIVYASAVVLLLILGVSGAWYVFKPVDHRLYATNESGSEQISLTFLYTVDPDTNKVLVYSPVLQGTMRGYGNLKQTKCFITTDKTATGHPTACNRVETDSGNNTGDNRPLLIWYDMQDQYQQQYFTQGQIVFIVEQPLVMDQEHYLVNIPLVAASVAN